MQCNKPLSLPTVLGAETSATEDDDHWMLSLQFGELTTFRAVVGKLVVGENSPWNNVRSHGRTSLLSSTKHPVSRDACESKLANSQATRLTRSRAAEGPASRRRRCRAQQCRLRRRRSHHA